MAHVQGQLISSLHIHIPVALYISLTKPSRRWSTYERTPPPRTNRNNKRDLSPDGNYERDTSKKVTFASDVTNALLLTGTEYDEDDAHMSDARTGNYTEGGFPGMQ